MHVPQPLLCAIYHLRSAVAHTPLHWSHDSDQLALLNQHVRVVGVSPVLCRASKEHRAFQIVNLAVGIGAPNHLVVGELCAVHGEPANTICCRVHRECGGCGIHTVDRSST